MKDTEAPVFNCSLLQQVYVTADTYKPKNGQTQYLEYATKDNVTLTEDSIGYNQWNMPVTYNVRHTYEGTMGDAFADGKIRMLTAGDVTDNCSGDVTVTASLTGPNEKKVERTVVINSTSDLENLKYGIGLTVITFTFKDKSGNESSCTQNIIVTAGTTPVPECPTPFHDTVYVNNECLASLKIEKDDVPTAQIPVNRTGVYFNFRQPVIAGMNFDEGKCDTVKKYFPNLIYHLHNANGDKYLNENATVQVQTGFFQTIVLPKLNPEGICAMANDYLNNNLQYNDWYFYQAYQTTPGNWFSPPTPIAGITVQNSNHIISSSDGLTKPRNYTGYPYMVTLEDAEGTVLETVLNPYTDEDKVPTRIVVPRWYSTTYNTTSVKYCDDAEDRLALVCETQDVKIVNNFESTILEVSNLTKGTYYVRYHFQDRKDGENEAECVHEITVLDTIKPKVECGDWSNEGTFPANENCQLPTSEVSWFKVPTATKQMMLIECMARVSLRAPSTPNSVASE